MPAVPPTPTDSAPLIPSLRPGEVERNPLGLPEDVARTIVTHLDEAVANLYVTYHQVKKHHWIVEGPDFRDLHHLLDEMAERLTKDADHLAERITALGGIPTSSAAAQQELATVGPEPEGRFPLRTMLENDFRLLQGTVMHLREGSELARAHGDYGTSHLLDKVLYHQEENLHHLDHVLARESLEY
ncbi:MAG TPA: DNA starvation/stationary phase protection protein DpsA [Candidatus Thermoplasmatota archaeon]|nr:DNA starvation/stationary phase protection protein DpsA [Candidatus Thermoplasmatota archaeon]